LLSTLPAIATCLLGVLAGLLLQRADVPEPRKVLWLLGAGAASLVFGWLWSLQFPVIKKIWTSSYVLVAAGWSAILLAAFHQVIAVWGFRRWCVPFVWVGANAITLYLVNNIANPTGLARRLAGGDVQNVSRPHAGPRRGRVGDRPGDRRTVAGPGAVLVSTEDFSPGVGVRGKETSEDRLPRILSLACSIVCDGDGD
jgi:hypothetical protein